MIRVQWFGVRGEPRLPRPLVGPVAAARPGVPGTALPTVRALPGSAEAIPLSDASVDAVLAGHALHWFDMDVAGPEMARVLVPGGVLAGLWNVIDDRVDRAAGLGRVSGSEAIGPRDTCSGWRAETADAHLPHSGLARFGSPEQAESPMLTGVLRVRRLCGSLTGTPDEGADNSLIVERLSGLLHGELVSHDHGRLAPERNEPRVPHVSPLVSGAAGGAVRLAVSDRALVLVAGMPGAGKSTLLGGLVPDRRVVVLDSDAQRAALRRSLPNVPYGWYRWLVHLLHRTGVLWAALSRTPVVVVHLPATDPGTRAALARLAALTGRRAHLLWLHVDPADALRGQARRGRVVPTRSFTRHAAAAAQVPRPSPEWSSVTVLDRSRARAGLDLDPPVRRDPVGAQ